jgi:hypothetical protein
MRSCLIGFALLAMLALSGTTASADTLGDARRHYNLGQYEVAERLARDAANDASRADAARVVLGRIQLERFRKSSDVKDFNLARESLRMVDATKLHTSERVELTIGFAEALFLEGRFAAAAQLFESLRARAALLGSSAHERVLDWWATSLDRQAQLRSEDERKAYYAQIIDRMTIEAADNPGSTAAGYWLAAAARANGDLETAWHAALAGWLRAVLADEPENTLRADLDRLMTTAIIPERAAKLGPRVDVKDAEAAMLEEWTAFKNTWHRHPRSDGAV